MKKAWHNSFNAVSLHTPSQRQVEKENTYGVVYEIPCHNCDVKYVGEMDRKFITRLNEHQKDARNVPQVYTRSERKSSETCFNKSAATDNIAKTITVEQIRRVFGDN